LVKEAPAVAQPNDFVGYPQCGLADQAAGRIDLAVGSESQGGTAYSSRAAAAN
jgi:hypothetical protein